MVPPAIWLIWHSPKLKQWLVSSWVVRLFGLYVLLHIVLGVWAYADGEVNKTALAYALIVNLRFIAFFVLCAVVATHSDFLRRHWQKILLIPAGAVILFGLAQKFLLPLDFLKHFGYGPKTIPAYQTVDTSLDFRRLASTLRGANPLGAYLVLIITAFWLVIKKLGHKVLAVAALAVVLFFSYSRSAEIGAAISIGTLVWWSLGKKARARHILAASAAVVVIMAGGIFVFRNNQVIQDTFFHTSQASTSQRSSNADRLQALKNGTSDIVHQPLGRGPGTAGPASARNDVPARISENYFLQIGQEVGVIGVAIFIAINILAAKQLWISRNEQLAKVLLASFVGITFVNLLSHAWTDDTLAYLWWGLAGIALAPRLAKSKR